MTGDGTVSLTYFELGAGDTLTIGTDIFSGTTGPVGLAVTTATVFTFFADNSPFTVEDGFELCISP